MRAALLLAMLWLTGCAALPGILAAASQGAQLLGHVLDEADVGAGKYFARHPNMEWALALNDSLLRARRSTRELDEAIVYGDEAAVREAQKQALADYTRLFDVLRASGVLDGVCPAPCGGAEGPGMAPEPLRLPTPKEIAQVM